MSKEFINEIKVYYEDTDTGGVVYYANYLKFLERARTEALFSIGFSNKKIQEQFNSLIIVKSCNIEYKKSAHLEDELTIRSFIKSITIICKWDRDTHAKIVGDVKMRSTSIAVQLGRSVHITVYKVTTTSAHFTCVLGGGKKRSTFNILICFICTQFQAVSHCLSKEH